MATNWAVFPEDSDPPKLVLALATQVEGDGGHVLAVYQEPLEDAWQMFVLLPLARVEPTPYQRDLSKPHVKRLQEVIKKLGRFVDPIVVVSTGPGKLDAERQPPPRGAHEAQGRVDARDPRSRA